MLNRFSRPTFLAALLALALTGLVQLQAMAAPADPLPSWNDGHAKQSILDFVAAVTKEDGPDYVKPAERIATIDNDGTLWVEQPVYTQFAFAIDRVKATANQHPEWKTQEPFKSILSGDMKSVATMGEKGMVEIVAATHSGMSTADFNKEVKEWLAVAKHPRFKVLYTDLVYQPMIELLDYPAPTASRPLSCRAAASSSCGRSPTRPTAFRRSRSSAPPVSRNIRCGTQAPC